MSVVDDGGYRNLAIEDVEPDRPGVGIVGVLPQLADRCGTVGDLLSAEMVYRSCTDSEGDSSHLGSP